MFPEIWTMPGTGWTLRSYGFMMMIGFLSGVYLAMRRAMKVKCDPDVVLNCAFIALIVGVAGARIMYVVHYWDEGFADQPNPFWSIINISQGGLEFLGGLVPCLIAVPLYLKLTGRSVRVYTDILAVSTMWSLGIARIGCFLNGCCFGGLCVDAQGAAASSLAVRFPFGSPAMVRQWERRQLALPAELINDSFKHGLNERFWDAQPLSREVLHKSVEEIAKPMRRYEESLEAYQKARRENPESAETKQLEKAFQLAKTDAIKSQNEIDPLVRAEKLVSREDPMHLTTQTELQSLARQYSSLPVHPTQLYSAFHAIILSILLGRLFYRRKRHGIVFATMVILYPIGRFLLESIRADNPTDTFGLTVSQATSVAMFLVGITYLVILYRAFPERSPRAIPFVPEEE